MFTLSPFLVCPKSIELNQDKIETSAGPSYVQGVNFLLCCQLKCSSSLSQSQTLKSACMHAHTHAHTKHGSNTSQRKAIGIFFLYYKFVHHLKNVHHNKNILGNQIND